MRVKSKPNEVADDPAKLSYRLQDLSGTDFSLIRAFLKNAGILLILLLIFPQSAPSKTNTQAQQPPPNIPFSKPMPTRSQITFVQTTQDFGQVPRNMELHYAFKYGVSSLDTVKIIHSASSCGCTFAKIPSKPLPPRDTGHIEVTYTTGFIEGPFQKTFTLYTNSESSPEIQLVLKGTVIRCVWIDPPIITLDEAQIGSGWKKGIKIHWQRWGKPGFKKAVKIPGALAGDAITRDPADSTVWALPVALSKSAEAKYYQDSILIFTSDTGWPQIAIPVQGTITDVVVAKPLVVNFGQVKIGEQVNNSFLVVSAVTGANVVSAKATTPFISAQIGKSQNNGRLTRINLSTAGTPEPGSIGTDIILTVAVAGKQRELKVPVVGRFVR